MATLTRERRIVETARDRARKAQSAREAIRELASPSRSPYGRGDRVYVPTAKRFAKVRNSTPAYTEVVYPDGRRATLRTERVTTPPHLDRQTKAGRARAYGRDLAQVDAALADLRRRK